MRENQTTDRALRTHPAADIETVVADPEDIIEAFTRNHEEEGLRTHVLRLTPPFEGEVQAEPYGQEGPKRYPPDRDPEPIHLDPATFVRNEAGVHPNETHLTVPTREAVRERATTDHDDELDEDVLEEEYEAALEEWESQVRDSLITSVRIYFDHRDADEIWTNARYVASDE
ncbi:hypothetical protein [Halostagnicola bangensis]